MKFPSGSTLAGVLAAFSLSLSLVQAGAPLPPNSAVLGLSAGSGPVGASLVASSNVPFNGLDFANNILFSGSLLSSVYSGDTSNPYGGLTFTYQLSSLPSSVNAIDRLTLNRFSGVQADVSYTGAGIVPSRASRTANGDLIAFVFEDGLFLPSLVPGGSSPILVIQTSSQVYDIGNASIIDGATASVPTYTPLAVPEPTTLALSALGILALAARRKS